MIQPPYTIYKHEPKGCQPPLGLAYIAAAVEPYHDIKILDCSAEGYNIEEPHDNKMLTYGLSSQEIFKKIKDYQPDVVGISCLFSTQAVNMHRVASVTKSVSTSIKVVVGGSHPSSTINQTMQDPNIDFVVIGEGEAAFLSLCNALRNNGDGYREIDGFAYRAGNNEIVVNPKNSYIEDLDSLPFPSRHLLPMDKYFEINSPHGTATRLSPNTQLISSRGCPMKCTFCSIHTVWGRSFRYRSPANVVKELKHLKEVYGMREIQFEDDNLTYDMTRAKELFRLMIKEDLDILWTTPNGIAVYKVDEELVVLMKKSGCYRVCIGVESGDQDTLQRIIHKPVNLKKVPEIVKLFKKNNIIVDAFFIVGFPGETKEKIRNTFKYARSLDVENVYFFIATPYPGTELCDICRDNNYISDDYDFKKARVSQSSISTPDFTSNDLLKWVNKENVKIRLRMIKKPKVFYERVFKRFFKDPRFAWHYIKEKLSGTFSK